MADVPAGRCAHVVQRRLTHEALQENAETNQEFVALASAVHEYNALLADALDVEGLTSALDALAQVERAVATWFDGVSARASELTEDPGYGLVRQVADEAERERIELVDRAKDLDGFMPVKAGEGVDQGAIQALWQQIVAGTGKIKLLGPAESASRKRALAQLFSILQTPTGRRLLTYLNTEPARLGRAQARLMTNVYIGANSGQLPESVRHASPGLFDPDESIAQPLGPPTPESVRVSAATGRERQVDYPDASDDLTVIRDAAWSGTAKGFLKDGRRYRFRGRRHRVGAFVTVGDGAPARHGAPGPGHHEIHAPAYLTLAHELGHAANMRAGATMMGLKAASLPDFAEGTAEELGDRWQNVEELVNISNVENQIRREAGFVSERGSHVPHDYFRLKAQGMQNRDAFLAERAAFYREHPPPEGVHLDGEGLRALTAGVSVREWADEEIHQSILGRWNEFKDEELRRFGYVDL